MFLISDFKLLYKVSFLLLNKINLYQTNAHGMFLYYCADSMIILYFQYDQNLN
jgi:hypothetical protein